MLSLLSLYLSYLKTCALVMLWAALAFSVYGLIRSSAVGEVVAAASVSVLLSLVAALLVADLLSPSRPVRRLAAMVFTPVLSWLGRPASHSGGKQGI